MQADDSETWPPAQPTRTAPDLAIERVFNAPRELVFAAWSDAERLVQWMGPVDHPAVAFEQDLRVGGIWHGTLRPVAGGEDLHQGGQYLEVDPPARLVFTFQWQGDNHEDGPGVPTVVSIDLYEEGTQTRMRFRQSGLKSSESATGHRAGWWSTFDRLDEFLRASRAPASPLIGEQP